MPRCRRRRHLHLLLACTALVACGRRTTRDLLGVWRSDDETVRQFAAQMHGEPDATARARVAELSVELEFRSGRKYRFAARTPGGDLSDSGTFTIKEQGGPAFMLQTKSASGDRGAWRAALRDGRLEIDLRGLRLSLVRRAD